MLRITYRQRRLLRRIDRALRQSDPELAAMLSIFSRLNAGERMPAWEQLRTPEPSASWYMMPWPMAIALLAIWAPAAGPGTLRRGLTAAGPGAPTRLSSRHSRRAPGLGPEGHAVR
jgi:hypothetical protein